MESTTIFSILLGIGLAASVGFRIFVPLFALSIASYYNVIPLNDNWEWISGMEIHTGVNITSQGVTSPFTIFKNIDDSDSVVVAAGTYSHM